jgi:Xaa-Pro aminopeptidase
VFRSRHAALQQRLGGRTALIFAGGLKSRNYTDNVYPYRADSHFLYLVGASLADGALTVAEDRVELFLPVTDATDALWHGPLPDWDEIRARTGVHAVRPLPELGDAVKAAATVGTLPSADPLTRVQQRELLGRQWPFGEAPEVERLHADDLAVADAVIDVRLRHDGPAIDQIRRAVEATTAAHAAGMAVTRPGLFEHDIRATMEKELLARGMPCAYGSIITTSGEVLHNNDYHQQLSDGDLLLVDLGGEHEGWASDVTRTWPVSGTFSPTQRALYDIVLQAEQDAIDMVKPGARYRDVHLGAALTLARGLVDEGILKGDPQGLVERGAHALFFPHGVGHLLGLDVHDMEDLGDRAGYGPGRTRSEQFGLGYLRLDRDLEPGMVVTIEPGLYVVPAILASEDIAGPFDADGTLNREALKRFSDVRGIRIEDDVLCTPTGNEVLTAAIPKEAAAVQERVGTAG